MMKPIQSIGKDYKPAEQRESHELTNKVSDQARQIVDSVFEQLSVIFPAYKSAFKGKTDQETERNIALAKREWIKSFYENGINNTSLVKNGLIMARKSNSDFMPSCGKFINWCKVQPEQIGWPTLDVAMAHCIKYHAEQTLYPPPKTLPRPMIIKLTSMINWSLMNSATNEQSRARADKHFSKKYYELFESGYVEPENLDNVQLPTPEIINSNLSEQQKADKKARAMEHIANFRAKYSGDNND